MIGVVYRRFANREWTPILVDPMFQAPVISGESVSTLVFDDSLTGASGTFSTPVKPSPRYHGAAYLLPRDLRPLHCPEPSFTYRRGSQLLVPSPPLIRFQQVPPALINQISRSSRPTSNTSPRSWPRIPFSPHEFLSILSVRLI